MHSTWQAVLAWLNAHESLFIFLAILLEESGIPMPLPADIAMALAGYRVAQGQMSILEAFAIGQVATLTGSSLLFWVGRRGGRPLLARYGKYLFISPERLDQAERLITRHGPLVVIIGRQIPGLRLASPLACGVFRVPYRVFLPAMFVGSTVYIGAFIALGIYGGPTVFTYFQSHAFPVRFIVASALLIGSVAILRVLSRRAKEVQRTLELLPSPVRPVTPVPDGHRHSRLERVGEAIAVRMPVTARRTFDATLIAGIGASVVTGLAVTWLLELASFAMPASPEYALLRFLEGRPGPGGWLVSPGSITAVLSQQVALTGLRWTSFGGLLVTVPLQVIGLLFWAMLYGFVLERRLRGSPLLRGLQFSMVLWVLIGIVVYPVLGAGLFGVRLNAGWAPALAELVRHAVFGTTLGVLHDALRLVSQPRGGASITGTFPLIVRSAPSSP